MRPATSSRFTAAWKSLLRRCWRIAKSAFFYEPAAVMNNPPRLIVAIFLLAACIVCMGLFALTYRSVHGEVNVSAARANGRLPEPLRLPDTAKRVSFLSSVSHQPYWFIAFTADKPTRDYYIFELTNRAKCVFVPRDKADGTSGLGNVPNWFGPDLRNCTAIESDPSKSASRWCITIFSNDADDSIFLSASLL